MDQKIIQELSSTGRHQECLEFCQKLLQHEPENPSPWKYAGKSLLALGQIEKAHQCLEKAHYLDINDPEIAKDIGNAFLKLGKRSEAKKWYQKSFKINNNYTPAINKFASIERQIGNNQKAAYLFKKAIQADPQFTQAYLGAAASLSALGDLDQAEEIASQAIEINGHVPGVNEILGIIYQNKKNSEQAIESYQKELAVNPQSNTSLLNLGLLLLQQGKTAAAIEPLAKAAAINPSDQCSLLLGQAYQSIGKLKEAIYEYKKIDLKKTQNKIIPFNIGLCLLNIGSNADAIEAFKIAIQLDESFLPAWGNIGTALVNEGRHHEALIATQKAIELDPENPAAHLNLGSIYQNLGKFEQALVSTLKSLELKSDNPKALLNLGSIYQDLGDLDGALSSILKLLDHKTDNPDAINNLKVLFRQLDLSPSNAKDLTRAYELLLNQTDMSHLRLIRIFQQAFLPNIQQALTSDSILSEGNQAFKALAVDWRFLKSLRVLIPPIPKAEAFLTRLRKELLVEAIQKGAIPQRFKPLTESLAVQCFLNEYVYFSTQEEDISIAKLIKKAAKSQESVNSYLAIIGCYKAIHETNISPDLIHHYPTPHESSKELISAQFNEPREEQQIKKLLHKAYKITDVISRRVQDLYEVNPYPRFKYSEYTASHLAKPICYSIKLETTRINQSFSEELTASSARPKVLLAGCGTGNQVIMASRYKNAQITAIDLSSSSLAYAIRKVNEYHMSGVTFKQMDLLSTPKMGVIFDIIECSGVLHHMDKPAEGLSTLLQQLKPGGYIKLGLYSEIARKVIVEARKTIKKLGISSCPESIRGFRKKVLDGKVHDLLSLPEYVRDFYSLSECRDLCFHVQEHRYTIDTLKDLLDSHDLAFCGFILQGQIKKMYQEEYPEDKDMTLFENWAKFEEKHPSIFTGMYQFWAQKST